MKKMSDQEINRNLKLKKLIENNQNPFWENKFDYNYNAKKFFADFNSFTKEQLLAKEDTYPLIKMAGRIKRFRLSGKVIFANLSDENQEFQIYIKKDLISNFAQVKEYDIGDIVAVVGKAMKTRIQTLTLKVTAIKLLAKALKPLPEKYHGLVDVETRYRKRYLDLIMNQASKNVFIKRTQIINEMRNYLNKHNFLEVQTPILQPIHGGAIAKPFVTFHNSLNQKLYLRIATELYLKRLIIGGFNKVYEIGPIFRNEGISPKHNPEFYSLEAYWAYTDYQQMITLCEDLINDIILKLNHNSLELKYQNIVLNFQKPYAKLTMIEAVKKYCQIDFLTITSFEQALELAKKHNLPVQKHHNRINHILNLFFEEKVEQHLIQPTIIYQYPSEISPLAKRIKNNPSFCERFELFINTIEFANAFSELNDPHEQYLQFKNQVNSKKIGNLEYHEIDYDYLEALKYGLAPTGGIGIGIDRLVMLICNQTSIKDVLLFPQLKSIK